MEEETSEPNRNEKHIKYRILSWCGNHKMQIISIVIVGIVLLGGVSHMLSQESHVEVDSKWTTGDNVWIHPELGDPMVEVFADEPAQLTAKITTDQPGNLFLECYASAGASEVEFSLDKLNWSKSISLDPQPCMYPLTVTVEIWVKAPLEEEIYANKIEFCGQLDSYPTECNSVWLRIEGAMEEETGETGEEDDNEDGWPCSGTNVLVALTLLGWMTIASRNLRKKNQS